MAIDIRLLRHFDAVYRRKSFVKAAEEQAVTQSAITKSIKLLEAKLGGVLFDRTTSRVTPTDTGDHLIVYARDVIASLSAFEKQSGQLKGVETGTLDIGAGPYPLQKLLAQTIRSFSQHHPFVQINIHTGSPDILLSSLIARELDMVISDISKFETMSFFKQLQIHALPGEPLVIVHRKNHPISNHAFNTTSKSEPSESLTLSMEALLQYPWALPTTSPHFTRLVSAYAKADKPQFPFPLYRVEVPSVCIELVRGSDVLTSVPKSHAVDICQNPMFAMTALPPAFQTNDGIHTLKNKTPSPAAGQFQSHLKAIAERR